MKHLIVFDKYLEQLGVYIILLLHEVLYCHVFFNLRSCETCNLNVNNTSNKVNRIHFTVHFYMYQIAHQSLLRHLQFLDAHPYLPALT